MSRPRNVRCGMCRALFDGVAIYCPNCGRRNPLVDVSNIARIEIEMERPLYNAIVELAKARGSMDIEGLVLEIIYEGVGSRNRQGGTGK